MSSPEPQIVTVPTRKSSRTGGQPPIPPRRWLMDRIRGTSKYNDRERPPGPCCWVPPPVGWCPGLWEENVLCKAFGSIGPYKSEKSRFYCLHLGILANLIAFCLLTYSCLSLSYDFTILTRTSFGSLTMTERENKIPGETFLRIGLRAVALDNPFTGVDRTVVGFDKFCDLSQVGLQRYMDPMNCAKCEENSVRFCLSAILAAISILPTFFTDILRMFSGYDVNCQKTFAVFFSICTILLCLHTMFSWKFYCGDNFYKNDIYLNRDGNRVQFDDPDREYTIDYNYTWGWGMMTMIVACFFKCLQVMTHICIPTPNVTRDVKEQRLYEVVKESDMA